MKRLILWDLDGTLMDTLEDLAAAVNHALALRGLPLHRTEEYRTMVGHGVRNLVKSALEASSQKAQALEASFQKAQALETSFQNGTSSLPSLDDAYIDSALADFKAYYSANIDVHTRPYPGMQDLLTELQARGVRMAVASNKFQEGTERLIREFFPDIDFVVILGNRPGFPLKPSPAIVEEVLACAGRARMTDGGSIDAARGAGAMWDAEVNVGPTKDGILEIADGTIRHASNIQPSDAILIGDSPTDMRTAANGGIDAVAVSWGYRTPEELKGYRIVNSINELKDIIL